MAGTQEYTKTDLVNMASHVSNKDVSSFSRGDLLSFVKEAVMNLKVRASKITFPATVVFENVSTALKAAKLQLLGFAGSKAVFGVRSGKTGIKLVSVTDASKKSRRKLSVHFGSIGIGSEVFELTPMDKGTRTCGSQSQNVLVIDNAMVDEIGIEAITAEITNLAIATREDRHSKMSAMAAEKAASRVDNKFSGK